MKRSFSYLFVCLLVELLANYARCDLFKGGWLTAYAEKSSTVYVSVKFKWSLAWQRSASTVSYCDETYLSSGANSNKLIGEPNDLKCLVACKSPNEVLGQSSIYCSAYSSELDWSIGSNSLLQNVAVTDNYTLLVSNLTWPELVLSKNNPTPHSNLKLKIYTKNRQDTKQLNYAPTPTMLPVVNVRSGVRYPLKITYFDNDYDVVKCRWADLARGECEDVCNGVPFGTLNETNCELELDTQNVAVGKYVAAIQLEDYQTLDPNPLSNKY